MAPPSVGIVTFLSRIFPRRLLDTFANLSVNEEPDPPPPSPEVDVTSPISVLPDDILIECLSRISVHVLGPAQGVCTRWRSLLASKAYMQSRLNLGRCFDRLVVVSVNPDGTDHDRPILAQMYRPEADTWQAGYPRSKAISIDESSSSWGAGKFIYFFGGILSSLRSDPPLLYDLWTNQDTRMRGPLAPRTRFVGGVIGDKLYIAGGVRNKGSPRASTGSSTEYATNEAEGEVGAGRSEDGGSGAETGTDKKGQADHRAAKGERAGSRGRAWRSSVGRKGGEALEGPRHDSRDTRDLRSAEVYNPARDKWQALPDMTHSRVGAAGGVVGGKLYVIGGSTKMVNPPPKVSHLSSST